ncbi:hypothetical protein ACLMJK_005394 [Lecanora helva]
MTSAFYNSGPQWHWPAGTGVSSGTAINETASQMPGAFSDEIHRTSAPESGQRPRPRHTEEASHEPQKDANTAPKPNKHWPPRTCRICLEVVNPTFHPPSENIPGLFQAAPSVTYESSDPKDGRLLRPCKCKGSSKYVHEGCLQAWRHADPGYGKRNYWQCPTCGFRYRLERMQWGRWISSSATQIILTASIFIAALFIMGFIADPIINLYFDPLSIISSAPLSKVGQRIEPILTDDDVPTWTEHFIKGLASLGLLGFVKVIFALSPWHWWNYRSAGIIRGGQSGNTGRDRLANISWIVVIIGVGTFLWAVYKGVRAWCRRTLEKAGERVMDVPGNDDDDEDN